MKKETKAPVYNGNILKPIAEINPDEIEFDNEPAQPTSRLLSGTNDHWAAEEWVADGTTPDGHKCQVFYLFSSDEIITEDGESLDADCYPWDAEHVSRVVLADVPEIKEIIDRAEADFKN